MARWRMSGDGNDIRMHLIDKHLTKIIFGQLAMQQIQSTFGCDNSSFVIDLFAPLLVLTFLVNDMNLRKKCDD